MTYFTPLLLLASLLALSSAAPFLPRFPTTGDFERARSAGFSIGWSPGEKALLQRLTLGWSPGEKALLQRISIGWSPGEKALLQRFTIGWSPGEKALLQSIRDSWKAQQKAFLQGLLEELSDDEKAVLQRISTSIGKDDLDLSDINDIFRILDQPTTPGEARAETVRYPVVPVRGFGKANAERLEATDIINLVGDLSSNVADRLDSNKDSGKTRLGASDILSIVSDLASKVSDRIDSNGGSQAKEQGFDFGDALKLATIVAPYVASG